MQHNKKMLQFIMLFIGMMALVFSFGLESKSNISDVEAAEIVETPVLTVVSRTSSSVNLKFTKSKGATGYQVYRATSKNGTYTKVKTTKALTYKDTNTTSSKTYYYKVRAYQTSAGKNSYSNFSAIKSVRAVLGKTLKLTATASENSIKLSWGTVSRATSYRIYRATSLNGTYQYVTSTKSTSYTNKNLTANKTYYYKVRAYAVLSSAKYYGSYSAVASAKTKSTSSNNGGQAESSYLQEVLNLVNKERAAAGLSSLTTTTSLKQAAYKRAVETASVFEHTRPDGSSFSTVLGEYNITYMACGENIAYGQQTPASVMEGWMNSSGHRANILSSQFGKVGIGYYVINNTPYWVQVFTN